MKPTLTAHRAYFFVVIWFTLWVGCFGFFKPEEILRALPWPVPPLHARFVGAIYLGASTFLALSLFARSLAAVRTVVRIAFWWTGWLLVVTFLHWSAFDFARVQTWFWVVAYIAFPLAAAWLAWGPGAPRAEFAAGDCWQGRALAHVTFGFGGAFLVLAAISFFAPSWAVAVWPWKLTPFLAQVYSGPILAFGIGLVEIARRRSRVEARFPALGLLVAASLGIVASLRHAPLFVAGSLSRTIWFATLGAIVCYSLVLTATSLREGSNR
jgi:hypothetical protein